MEKLSDKFANLGAPNLSRRGLAPVTEPPARKRVVAAKAESAAEPKGKTPARVKKWREANREKHLAAERERQKKRREKAKEAT